MNPTIIKFPPDPIDFTPRDSGGPMRASLASFGVLRIQLNPRQLAELHRQLSGVPRSTADNLLKRFSRYPPLEWKKLNEN